MYKLENHYTTEVSNRSEIFKPYSQLRGLASGGKLPENLALKASRV